MANHESAKKAMRQTEKRTLMNKSRLSRAKTYLKKFFSAVSSSSDAATLNATFKDAQSELAKAAKAGVIKKNTFARRVSRMNKMLQNTSAV